MKLELRTRHVTAEADLRRLCERSLLHALGRFEDRIRRVQLWIEDVNGPRGGRDARCVLRVGLRHGGSLKVESTRMRPEAAVAHVFDRVREALVRTVERRRWAPMRRALRTARAESASLPRPCAHTAGCCSGSSSVQGWGSSPGPSGATRRGSSGP